MTPEEVKENMKIATKPVSMDAPLTTDEESISLYDVYIASDPSIQAPESSLNQDSLKTDIERSFAALSVREATILSMYYGLNGYSSMSLEEIGTKLGLTSERVRQVKTKACLLYTSDTCWGEKNEEADFLFFLQKFLQKRKNDSPEESYTARLISKGINKVAQKVGEEAVELVIEAKDDNEDLFLNEAADLMYHYLVLLIAKGYGLEDVIRVLKERHK